jgi:hypothetical protein
VGKSEKSKAFPSTAAGKLELIQSMLADGIVGEKAINKMRNKILYGVPWHVNLSAPEYMKACDSKLGRLIRCGS